MSPRPPAVVIVARALVALAIESALLAWGVGGVRALLASPRALALIAIWGIVGLTLGFARPARGQDVVRAERDPLAMIALALIPLAIPGVAAWGGRLGVWPLPAAMLIGWAGVVLSAIGLGLRVAAMRQLGVRFSPLLAVQREHALETTGWYARVRHPGYLGSLLASWGAAIAFGSAMALPLALLMTAFQWDRVRREERLLEGQFGDAWRAYAARTGALLPRLR
ncbi:MAG TPA: isoprenylcysteine carboxylmethyltransferase family protein [Methylomirabilota bacterium]|jgi:protein-S-isoprenylcysteine O-methyltransferase Ste14|nr:isoprenylcysteine carboxylmethyltransferase family protein [Methylomirabilota bacterium]